MKYTIKTIFIALLTVLVMGCEHDQVSEGYLNNRDSFAFFTRASGNYTQPENEEEQRSFIISVGVSAPKDIVRNITIEINPASTAIEGEDFDFINTVDSFGSGMIAEQIEVFSYFENLTEPKVLILDIVEFDEVITTTNRSTFRLTMEQSCPKEAEGSYFGSTAIGDDTVSSGFDVELVEIEENVYEVENVWGDFVAAATGNPAFAGDFPYVGTLEIFCDNTVEFTYTGGDPLTGGEGMFDPETGLIDLVLGQGLFTQPFDVLVTLEPQN